MMSMLQCSLLLQLALPIACPVSAIDDTIILLFPDLIRLRLETSCP